jgi:DNA-binding NarL/FixJ family response regulator
VRLILADDATFFREALAGALRGAGHEIIAEVGDGSALVDAVLAHRPDVAIVDIRMPPTGTTEGLEAAIRLRTQAPTIGLVLLSSTIETRHLDRLLQGGAQGVGYLLKDRVGAMQAFLEALERVAVGGSVIDPDVVAALLRRPRAPGPLDDLTPRERDVLALMAEGRSNGAIAERLVLTEKTVEGNIRVILSKLGLEPAAEDHRRVLAVLTWLRAADRPGAERPGAERPGAERPVGPKPSV